MTDIIDQINDAIGCQECGSSLERSVSDDFCSEYCQATWYRWRVKSSDDEIEFQPVRWTSIVELSEQTNRRVDWPVLGDLEDSLRYTWSTVLNEPDGWPSLVPVVEAPLITTHEGHRYATCFSCGYRYFSNSVGPTDSLHYCSPLGQLSHMVKWVQ